MAKVVGKKKVKKNIPTGICHIQCSFNNTIVSFTDTKGNAIAWASAGQLGFRGSKKATPFAAQMASTEAAKKSAGAWVGNLFSKGKGARSWSRECYSCSGGRGYKNYFGGRCVAYAP